MKLIEFILLIMSVFLSIYSVLQKEVSNSKKIILKLTLFLFVGLSLIGFIQLFIESLVRVPDLYDFTEQEAIELLTNQGLDYSVDEPKDFDFMLMGGHIGEQKPAPGKWVLRGTKVHYVQQASNVSYDYILFGKYNDETMIELKVGDSIAVDATQITSTDGSKVVLSYGIDETGIATVDKRGIIKGISPGLTKLYIYAESDTIRKSECEVFVGVTKDFTYQERVENSYQVLYSCDTMDFSNDTDRVVNYLYECMEEKGISTIDLYGKKTTGFEFVTSFPAYLCDYPSINDMEQYIYNHVKELTFSDMYLSIGPTEAFDGFSINIYKRY